MLLFFVSSFVMFNFFVLLMEFFPLAANGYNYNIKPFLDKSVYKFYIFFIAFYTICFNAFLLLEFWFHKPEKQKKHRKIRKFVIWDRRAFYHGFLLWLFRLIVFTTLLAYDGIFSCIGLFENYKHLLVLLAVVLFFDLNIGLRRVFKIKAVVFVVFFVLFTLLSLAYTYIRPYNDSVMLAFRNKSINVKEISLPTLDIKESSYANCNRHIYILSNGDIKGNLSEKPLSRTDFSHFIRDYHMERILQTSCLYIDKNTSMKDFNEIKFEMIRADKLRVNIAFYSSFSNCNVNAQYIKLGFPAYSYYHLRDSSDSRPPPPPIHFEDKFADSNIIHITFEDNVLEYEDSIIGFNALESLIINNYSNNKLFLFSYSKTTSFQSYLDVFISYRKALYSKRDELAIEKTGLTYLDLYYNDEHSSIYRKIRDQVPFFFDENQF